MTPARFSLHAGRHSAATPLCEQHVDSSYACILALRTHAMRRGMQDVAGLCMQNAAHASRLSVVNRTVPRQNAFTFASREHDRAPKRSLVPLVKHDVDSDHACILPPEYEVACRPNCSVISGFSLTELLALRSFSVTRHREAANGRR